LSKIIFILSVILISAGCSVFHPVERSEYYSTADRDWNSVQQLVVKQNITRHNFFISKARVEVVSDNGRDNFLATVKFLYPDTFLISFRSKTGIEAARVYITNDTILINDRINRKLLFGRPGTAGRKYGITPGILPVLLGDFISTNGNNLNNECVNGVAIVNTTIAGNKLSYIINCADAKVISVSRESSNNSSYSVIKFGKFIRESELYMPSNLSFDYPEMKVNIIIDKIEYPWNGNIEFIHGNNYELVELL